MDFFSKVGTMALGSRLRVLGEKLTEDAAEVYLQYGNNFKPKWFPVFYALGQSQHTQSITALAEEIGQSHPAISKTAKELKEAGLVEEARNTEDKRKNNLSLTSKGEAVFANMQDQFIDCTQAVDEMLEQTQHNLWAALEEFEYLIEQQSLAKRITQARKEREAQKVSIVEYNTTYRDSFRDLNEEWIQLHFEMEESDRKALHHPEEYIINKGGAILLALYNGKPVGTCALIKGTTAHNYDFELAKMAVSPIARGKGIGYLLGQAIVSKAKEMGGSLIYLESNTVLAPALKLYQKLGFRKVSGHPTPYARCNIQMELTV